MPQFYFPLFDLLSVQKLTPLCLPVFSMSSKFSLDTHPIYKVCSSAEEKMLEYIHIKNYKVRSLKLGSEKNPLPSRVVLTGRLDAPLDAVFDAFRFLKTATQYNIAAAVNEQGNFQRIALEPAPISFQLQYRTKNAHLRYEVVIAPPNNVQSEALISLKDNTKQDFSMVVNKKVLGNSVLGQFKNNVESLALLSFFEAWDLIDFAPPTTLSTRVASTNARLDLEGTNLTRALYAIKTYQPEKFQGINDKLRSHINLTVDIEVAKDDRLAIRLAKDNVVGDYETISVLKLLAYFVLAANPAPLIFVQYPERFLPEAAAAALVQDLSTTESQVFMTTYSSAVLNLMQPREIFVIPAGIMDFPAFPIWGEKK